MTVLTSIACILRLEILTLKYGVKNMQKLFCASLLYNSPHSALRTLTVAVSRNIF